MKWRNRKGVGDVDDGRTKRGAMDGGRESRVGSLCGSRRSGADTRGQRLI